MAAMDELDFDGFKDVMQEALDGTFETEWAFWQCSIAFYSHTDYFKALSKAEFLFPSISTRMNTLWLYQLRSSSLDVVCSEIVFSIFGLKKRCSQDEINH